MKRMVISADLLAMLQREADALPERETCGLLFGDGAARDGRITAAEPTCNVAPDPRAAFEIDPGRLIAAHRARRAGGPLVIGCYHSHPRGRAEPSPRDLAAAVVGSLWLILAGGDARLWHRGAEDFEEVELAAG